MKKAKKHINIRLSEDEIVDAFKPHLTGPYKDLLAEAIVGIADSDWQLEKIFKAAMGIKEKSIYPVGTILTVIYYDVSTYAMDEEKMKEEGLLKDDKMKVRVVGFDPWKINPYIVEYLIIKSDGERRMQQYNVNESTAQLAEEFPEHKASDLEELHF